MRWCNRNSFHRDELREILLTKSASSLLPSRKNKRHDSAHVRISHQILCKMTAKDKKTTLNLLCATSHAQTKTNSKRCLRTVVCH